MEAVEEDIVAAHIFLANHHMVAAHNCRKEPVVEIAAAYNMEPEQMHHQLGTMLHMQSDGYVARAYQRRKSMCC